MAVITKVKPRVPILRRAHPGARGLALCWALAEGAGPTARDLSGAGRHGTIFSGATWAAGEYGPALSCPGSDAATNGAAADLSGIGDPAAGNLTLLVSVRPSSVASTFGVLSLSNAPAASGATQAYLISCRGGIWKAEGYGGSSAPNLSGPAAVAGRWARLALTTDGAGNSTLYLDGAAVASGSTAPQSFIPGAIHAGRFDVQYDPMPGLIGFVALASRTWTAGEVKSWAADPFALIRPRESRLIDFGAALGGGPPPGPTGGVGLVGPGLVGSNPLISTIGGLVS
jgi:hypothetical protein